MHAVEAAGWGLGGATGIALALTTRGIVPPQFVRAWMGIGVGAMVLVVLGWALGAKKTPRSAARVSPS